MSDNAKCYSTSHEFRDTLAELGARHILIPPRTPRWNGKIERFFGTLDREWAHGRIWPDSRQRDRALSSFIRFYNRRRPHSACGGRPPITRVRADGARAPRSAGPAVISVACRRQSEPSYLSGVARLQHVDAPAGERAAVSLPAPVVLERDTEPDTKIHDGAVLDRQVLAHDLGHP